MENSQKIIKSFSLKESLNPKIWTTPTNPNTSKLKDNIRLKLLEISNQFQEFIGLEIIVSDVHMTGSLANFNWSEFSDIDLHLIVDFSQFSQKQKELYSELFKLKKTLFNLQHNIKIYNYDVELYVQDESEEHTSSGVYSVLFNEWIVTPKKEEFEVDKKTLMNKVNSWMTKIDETIEQAKEEKDLTDSLEFLNKLRKKIKEYRSTGLSKGGEFSYENLVFKFLRRNGYIEKLFNFENDIIDKKLSLKESLVKKIISEALMNPVGSKRVTSGWRTKGRPNHRGVDIGVNVGTPTYAPEDGTVVAARFMDRKEKGGGCGGFIKIKHPNNIETKYCHMRKIEVQPSQIVKRGDLIGYTGGDVGGFGSGNSQGPHLHFEVWVDGKDVDPMKMIGSELETPIKEPQPDVTQDDIEPVADTETDTDISDKIDDASKTIKDKLGDIKDKIKDPFSGLLSSPFLKMFKKDLSVRIQKLIDKNVTFSKETRDGKDVYNFSVVPVEKAMVFLGYAPSTYYVTAKYNDELIGYIKKFKEENNLGSDETMDKTDLEVLKKLVKAKEDSKKSEEEKKEDEKVTGDTKTKQSETPIVTSTDDDFYKKILEGLGAPITNENMKFLYAWRQSEKGGAKNNPFNTTYPLDKDTQICIYNCLKDGKGVKPTDCKTCPEGTKPGVKSYSKPEYGIEATIKTLQSKRYDYSCITNGLKNNIGAKKISECPAMDRWGTGDLVGKVIDGYEAGADFKNPPIVRA